MLTVKQIEAARYGEVPVRVHDGNGLYLRLSKGGTKTFQLRLRDDLLEERRILMQDWADYVTGGMTPLRLVVVL